MCKSIRSLLRLLVGGGLAFCAATGAAAPAVLLETLRLVPADGVPEGGFGRSVAIDGDVAVVAANPQPTPWGAGPEVAGAVYVFERDPVSGEWQQTAKLSSGRDGDLFGIDVAVDGNVIVVGAAHSYSTHVYEKLAGTWQQTAVLRRTSGDPALGNGYSVAVANGIIAIGDDYPHGMGLYRREAGGWVNIANYEQGFGLPDDDYFSPQVDISESHAIHGSWGADSLPPVPSTAFIYTPGAGDDWAQPTITSLTHPQDSGYPSGFSSDVMIAADTAVISDLLFTRNSAGQWIHTGQVVGAGAIDDDAAWILGHGLPYRYAPSLYRRNSADEWPLRAELTTSDAAESLRVSFSSGRALLANQNAAYFYDIPENLDRPDLQQDDFQDGDANGWLTTPGSLFTVVNSGAAWFFRQNSVAGLAAALWQSPITDDQAIQVDVTPRAFDGADRWFGLVARYTDANNYYYVTARSSGVIQLKRMLAGTFTTLESAALPVAVGTTNRIRLETIEDHVRVLVDDRLVMNVRDASLSEGVPGLMTYKARADFDNVVVNASPSYVAFADDFMAPSSWNWLSESGVWTRTNDDGSWVYRQSDLSGDARLLRTGAEAGLGTWGDQIVEADLRPTAFSGADRWVGLIARYRDIGNYHYVTLRSSGSLQIRKLVDGSIQTLASVPFTVQTNVTYRVRFEAIGTRLRVYVNGTLQAEATDASLTREMSSAGVAMYKAALDLDSFSVVQP